MSGTESSQPESPKSGTFVDKFKAASKSAAGQMKAAGQYAAKTAQRTKIASITLPGAYRALGKHICHEKAFLDEFPDQWKEVDDCLAQIKALQDQAAARPKAEGFGDKAKAAATATKETAQVKALEVRASQTMGRLGEAVFAKHGEQSGPEALVRPIVDARSQLQALDAEIAQLAESSKGKALTPKRIAIGGIAALLIVGVLVFWPGGSKERFVGSKDGSPFGVQGNGTAPPTETDYFEARLAWISEQYTKAGGKESEMRDSGKRFHDLYKHNFADMKRQMHGSLEGLIRGFDGTASDFDHLSPTNKQRVIEYLPQYSGVDISDTLQTIKTFKDLHNTSGMLNMVETYMRGVGFSDGTRAAKIDLRIPTDAQ